jgi:protein-tyrosine-phosphatase
MCKNNVSVAYEFCYQYGKKLHERRKAKTITAENFRAFKIILRACRAIEQQAFWNGYNDAKGL